MQATTTNRGAAVLVVVLALVAAPAQALRIAGTATDQGGFFSYELSVVENSFTNLTFVSFLDAPMVDPLIDPSLSAPAGFLASYDSGLGFLDFVAGIAIAFDVPDTGPFTFNSLSGPSGNFLVAQALDDFLEPLEIDSVDITVVQGPGRVPAPGSLALLALGLTLVAARRRQAR